MKNGCGVARAALGIAVLLLLSIGLARSQEAASTISAGQVADNQSPAGIVGHYLDGDTLTYLFHLNLEGAILVEQVVPGGAAHRAGLVGGTVPARIGDLNLLLGGDQIVAVGVAGECWGVCLASVPRIVASVDRLPVAFLRGGQTMSTVIELR